MSRPSNGVTTIRTIEHILFTAGLILMLAWGYDSLERTLSSRAALERFEARNAAKAMDHTFAGADLAKDMQLESSQWSIQRVLAYKESLTKKTDAPVAVLGIRKIGLRVPVFNGTDDLTLDRGVGRIVGTAQLGQSGNLGIAGHRDSFFRGLQHVESGDAIELDRPGHHADIYTITEIRIVAPEDTYVLNSTAVPTLTLVTCYPFYFVGHAPKRYIVTASITDAQKLESFVGNDLNFSGNSGQPKENRR
jgi:sortase A